MTVKSKKVSFRQKDKSIFDLKVENRNVHTRGQKVFSTFRSKNPRPKHPRPKSIL